jgi:ParB family chromosome partitioning protein
VIQPITVRRLSSEAYQLIAGERRWRAAKLARLERIPAYIREANDAEMMELAIIENIQRSDLNPIEEAVAYKNLMLHCGLTQEDVAERVKKGRSTVTNILGLLSLPLNMQDAVKEQKISLGHGKLLIGVKEDLGIQTAVFKAILEQELSIRETEHLIESYINKVKKSNTQAKKDTIPSAYRLVEDKLSAFFGSKVQMKYTENGAGQITIRYNSADDLTRILEVIEDKK